VFVLLTILIVQVLLAALLFGTLLIDRDRASGRSPLGPS
jgi:hypothetical protein